MEKIKFGETDSSSAAASAVLQPKPSGAQVKGHAGVQEKDKRTNGRQNLLIHGLTVERYREIYNSVLNPSALAALKSCKPSDYVCQVQELKQQLWMKMGQPQLQETLMEGGRVEFTEVLDLTSFLRRKLRSKDWYE